MTRGEALGRLGLAGDASPEQIKAAFRALARRLHPDVVGGGPDSHRRMTELNEAYAVLLGTVPPDPDPEPQAGDRGQRADRGAPSARISHSGNDAREDVLLAADGSLLVEAPADETFERLTEAAEQVGDLTYVDRSSGLLQFIVRHQLGPWCYVTCSLQGRAAFTEVFVTIESIDGQPTPPLDDILELLATELAATSA